MITRQLRRVVLWLARRLPAARRGSLDTDIADTVRALADEAGATGGAPAERAYLLRELVDVIRELRAGRRSEGGSHSSMQRVVDGMTDDLRASLRQWRSRPVATAGVIGTLALAVAAVTTTFGLLTAVLWRPLPFPQPERLVFVWESASDERGAFRVTSGRFFEWQQQTHAFEAMALFGAAGFSLESADGAVPIRGLRVSASYFKTLGVKPLLGRGLDDRDEVPGAPRVVLLSEAMWRTRFGGSLDVVGRDLRLSGEPFTVVGVMPAVVTPGWPSNPAHVAVDSDVREFWIPVQRTPEFVTSSRAHVFGVVGRLREGVAADRANGELLALAHADDADRHHGMTTPFRDQFVRDVRAPLLVLFSASLAVLLVACANLAALQVSRFEQRRTELATRAALGAGRVRLAGLLLTDASLLSLAGGGIGVWLSSVALAWIPGELPPSVPFLTAPSLDMRAAACACLAMAAITVVLSMWPVLRLRTLSSAPRGVVAAGRLRTYRGLVAVQVAVGVAVAVPAALLGESLASLHARAPGFIVDGVLVANWSLINRGGMSLDRAARFERAVTDAVSAIPGVAGVALAYDHPLEDNWTEAITVGGELASDRSVDAEAHLRIVSPSYFDALGVRILDGRAFEDREDISAPGAIVVNEAFAAAHGGRVLGRQLRSSAAVTAWGGSVPASYRIVGVAENERFRGLDVPSAPAIYVSTRQFPQTSATLLVRVTTGAASMASRLRGAIRSADPTATVGQVQSLSAILSDQLVPRRVTADLTGVFAASAVGLALLGLYGLMAVIVAGRTRELGVRLALGASPLAIGRAIIVESVGSAVLGIGLGIAVTVALGRFLERLLVDVSARDPWTVAAVAATVLAGAILAAATPALRAARVDPVVALRSEN